MVDMTSDKSARPAKSRAARRSNTCLRSLRSATFNAASFNEDEAQTEFKKLSISSAEIGMLLSPRNKPLNLAHLLIAAEHSD